MVRSIVTAWFLVSGVLAMAQTDVHTVTVPLLGVDGREIGVGTGTFRVLASASNDPSLWTGAVTSVHTARIGGTESHLELKAGRRNLTSKRAEIEQALRGLPRRFTDAERAEVKVVETLVTSPTRADSIPGNGGLFVGLCLLRGEGSRVLGVYLLVTHQDKTLVNTAVRSYSYSFEPRKP